MTELKFNIKHTHFQPTIISTLQNEVKISSEIVISNICLHDEDSFNSLIEYLKVLKGNSITLLDSY